MSKIAPSIKSIILGILALLVLGSIAATAFVAVSTIGDQTIEWMGVNYTVSSEVSSAVLSLLPLTIIMFIIGVAVAFIPKMKG